MPNDRQIADPMSCRDRCYSADDASLRIGRTFPPPDAFIRVCEKGVRNLFEFRRWQEARYPAIILTKLSVDIDPETQRTGEDACGFDGLRLGACPDVPDVPWDIASRKLPHALDPARREMPAFNGKVRINDDPGCEMKISDPMIAENSARV